MKRIASLVIVISGLAVAYLFFPRTDAISNEERPAGDEQPFDVASPAQVAQAHANNTPPELSEFGGNTIAWEREASVSIPGSEPIPVTLKRIILSHPPYPPTDKFLDQYQSLADQARDGDVAAARMIAKVLQTCSLIIADENSPSGSVTAEAQQSSETYCAGVTNDLVLESTYWAKMAAEGGDYIGIQTYAHLLGAGPERLELMERFWAGGNISALPTLSGGYFQGTHGASPSQPDYVRAYAYHLIYTKVHESADSVNTGANSTAGARLGSAIAVENHLRYLGGFLSPQQQLTAEKLAAELLARNSNCCIGSL